MTGFNHMATGAVIALAIRQPAVAIPMAFASHFILDGLPHYGVPMDRRHEYKSLKRMLVADVVCTAILVIALGLITRSWLVLICMFAAFSPDSVWGLKLLYDRLNGRRFSLPQDVFSRFHKKIQWGERHWGWAIEAIWAIGTLFVLNALVV